MNTYYHFNIYICLCVTFKKMSPNHKYISLIQVNSINDDSFILQIPFPLGVIHNSRRQRGISQMSTLVNNLQQINCLWGGREGSKNPKNLSM